MHYYRFSTV